MCGIAGIVLTDPKAPLSVREIVRSMNASLAHRGPDGEGLLCADAASLSLELWDGAGKPLSRSTAPRSTSVKLGLGHRRLAIVDLDAGAQPMSDESQQVWVVFNGEIYNYAELRSELEGLGHRFRTRSDTESILHAYQQWGDRCFEHLSGMFACAIWDERSASLLVGRDRLGIKPLLWAEVSGGFLFASELKALLATGLVEREVLPSAIYRFLYNLYVPAPETAIARVYALEPGHQLKWQNGKVSLKRYWSVSYRPAPRRKAADWVEQFRAQLAGAVKSHLMSDVPVGAFLSGGLDSSAVAALAVEASGDPGALLTTTVGFSDRRYDESDDAAIVARYLGTHHSVVRITPAEIEHSLEKVLGCYDQPFADSSAVPTYLLCQAASRSVKVALAGDGADELLAGYPRHRQYLVLDALRQAPARLRSSMAGIAQGIAATPGVKKRWGQPLSQLGVYLDALDPEADSMSAYVHLRNVFRGNLLSTLLATDFANSVAEVDPAAHIHAAASASDARTRLDRLLNVELLTYLPNDILTKVDIASMAFGLEVRVPFLDHHVVELVARMPTELKRNLTSSKVALRRAIAPSLPRHTLLKRKQGFHMPVGPWFRGGGKALLADTLLSQRCSTRGYFSPTAVERLVAEHTTGRADHASRLWALLQLEIWHQNFVDRNRAPTL